MKILIIGATGFIGKHLVRELVKKNKVKCLVRETSKKSDIKFLSNLGADICYGDVLDKKSLERAMKNIDAVFNLAGGGYIAATFKKGYEELRKNNVESAQNVFEIAAKSHVKRIVHFSSISAMGIIVEQELNESSLCKPETPHEVCKFETEQIAEKYKRDMLITIIRPGIVYGPYGLNSEILQLSRIMKKHFFIIPGNGKNIMPWVYVDDVVNATIIAFEKNEKSCEKFIIVSDPQPTFNELADSIKNNLNIKVLIIHIPRFLFVFVGYIFEFFGNLFGFAPVLNLVRARSMTSNRIYKIEKIKNMGYKQNSNLNDSMKKTIEWYKENGYL